MSLKIKSKPHLNFESGEVCFILLWKVRQNNPKRYWSVFYPAVKWAWFLLLKIFRGLLLIGFSWNSQWTDLVSSIRILKLNSLRHECFFSFVGKFTSRKNTFLLNLQKSNQHIEMKIKTWYWTLKEVSNLKLSPCLTCSVSRMKW